MSALRWPVAAMFSIVLASGVFAQNNDSPGRVVSTLIVGQVHPDHMDGNANFAARGATVIAHAQVREIVAAGQYAIERTLSVP